MTRTFRPFPLLKNQSKARASSAMPLPEKEYFALKEIEKRWGIKRPDTIYRLV